MLLGGAHEISEQGMGPVGSGFKLRMELHPHKPGLIPQFHDLHQFFAGAQSGKNQTFAGKHVAIEIVGGDARKLPVRRRLGR